MALADVPSTSTLDDAADAADAPNGAYLDRLMRRQSFEPLWRLFVNAPRPAKELTESFSALVHLRPFMAASIEHRAVHVGDGAHCRTGAMFALKTNAHNISVDPQVNVGLMEHWREQCGIRRLEWRKARIEDVAEELNALPAMPTIVTFVHAHVSVDEVLGALRWDMAFTLACCVPGRQLARRHVVTDSGDDASVLSEGRSYQVLLNRAGGPRS